MSGAPFWRNHLGLMAAGSAAYAMSTLFSAMKPVLLTRFVEEVQFSESLAGLIVATPFVGIACAALCIRGWILRAPYWQIVALFGCLLTGTEFLSVFAYSNAWIVLVAQFLGGISVGILMGCTSRMIATTSTPDQLFGFVDMTAVLLMSFMVAGVGAAVQAYGLSGGYGFASALALVFMIVMLGHRPPTTLAPAHTSHAPLDVNWRPVLTVFMGMLFVTCSGLGFAYMFTLARELGMRYDDAGSYIGIILFFSALACQAGGWCSARYGSTRPLAAAFVTCAVGWYVAIHANAPWLFLAALIPATFSLQFNFPILLALCGSLDSQGRWAGIGTPLLTSGFAWAAITAGAVVERWDVEALAVATALGMTTCLLLLFITSRPPMAVLEAES